MCLYLNMSPGGQNAPIDQAWVMCPFLRSRENGVPLWAILTDI